MKKFVSLLLSIMMVFSFAYAEETEVSITPVSVTEMPKPTGGIQTETAPSYDEDSHLELNDVGEMSDFEKYLYDAMYEQQAIIDIYSYRVSLTGFNDWFLKFTFKHPELFLIDNGFSTTRKNGYISTISPTYHVGKENRDNFINTLNQKLDEYYNLVKDEPDDLKKYLLIHSKMIRETYYDYSYNSNKSAHTAYSFFVNGAATCQGYANALLLIGEKVGFEVSCCYNRTSQVGHIWNYIKLNDKWYHTDATWDDYSALLSDGTYNNEKDQGGVYSNFLCSDETFALNGHGNKSDYKTFEDELPSCTDKTYESNEWAFNLKNDDNALYLMDFDYENANLFFDLVGAKDSMGNSLKFVTNNLYGNDAYISLPEISESKAKYYWFSKVNLPASKIRLVYKNDTHINAVTSYDISTKNSFTLSSVQIPLDEEAFAKSNSLTMYNWAGLKPLAEGNTFVSEDPNLPFGGNILLSSEDFNDISYTKTATENGLYYFENGILTLNVTATCDRDSNVHLKFNKQLEGTISEGDICMLTFKSKVNSGTPYLRWVLEHPETYKKALFQKVDVKNSSEWETYYIPFEGIDGVGRVSLRFGMNVQNIDIKDFQLINYGTNINIEDLPSSVTSSANGGNNGGSSGTGTIIPTPTPDTYTVTFNTNGDSSVSS